MPPARTLMRYSPRTRSPHAMPSNQAPYVLDTPAFRFGKLAAHVGRAPVGDGREVALATYLVARMVHDTLAERGIDVESRRERAAAARGWLSSMALPAPLRSAFAEVAAATSGAPDAVAPLFRRVMAITATSL